MSLLIKEIIRLLISVLLVVSSGVGGRGELSLAEVQCHLDKEGASDLVIDLIMNATSDRIFQESILLAIALLEGGNTVIQVSAGRGLQGSQVRLSTRMPNLQLNALKPFPSGRCEQNLNKVLSYVFNCNVKNLSQCCSTAVSMGEGGGGGGLKVPLGKGHIFCCQCISLVIF